MDDLITFLKDRLDEAEHRVHHGNDTWEGHDWHTAHCGWWTGEGIHDKCTCEVPKFVLDDVDSKRRIIRECENQAAWESTTGRRYPATTAWALAVTTLRVLALPFADHPLYQESWKP